MKYLMALTICLSVLYSGEGKIYSVDLERSTLKWTGTKVTGSHWGYVTMKEGSVMLEEKKVLSGDFTVDMKIITNEDLDNSQWKAKLLNHLRSDDFFDVTNYPTASFSLKSSLFQQGEIRVKGDLTIRGITHPVEFPALIQFSDEGPRATGQIKIDRTLYNMKYKSGNFFPEIGDKIIYDEFTVDFDIVTK